MRKYLRRKALQYFPLTIEPSEAAMGSLEIGLLPGDMWKIGGVLSTSWLMTKRLGR